MEKAKSWGFLTIETAIVLFVVSLTSALALRVHNNAYTSAISQSLSADARTLVGELGATAMDEPCTTWYVHAHSFWDIKESPASCGHHLKFHNDQFDRVDYEEWGEYEAIVGQSGVWDSWNQWLDGNTHLLRVADWNAVRPVGVCSETDPVAERLRAVRRVQVEWINSIGGQATPETVVYGPFINEYEYGWSIRPARPASLGQEAGYIAGFTRGTLRGYNPELADRPPDDRWERWPIIYDGDGCEVLVVRAGTSFFDGCGVQNGRILRVKPGPHEDWLGDVCGHGDTEDYS